MASPQEQQCVCADCGITISGVPVVPSLGTGPTPAQIEKLKPTVFLCAECAKDRGLSFDHVAVGRAAIPTPPAV